MDQPLITNVLGMDAPVEFDHGPAVVLCEPGVSFDYEPIRHYFAVPIAAPERSYAFAAYEKVVPAKVDPRAVAWVPVDREP